MMRLSINTKKSSCCSATHSQSKPSPRRSTKDAQTRSTLGEVSAQSSRLRTVADAGLIALVLGVVPAEVAGAEAAAARSSEE